MVISSKAEAESMAEVSPRLHENRQAAGAKVSRDGQRLSC